MAGQVDCELELAVEGDDIELELELKWSTNYRASAEAGLDLSEADESGEDESGEDDSEVGESEQDAVTANDIRDGASAEDVAGSGGGEAVPAAAQDRSAEPRRGGRRAAAAADKPALNGVDTAAVRAWAAANGLTVSPRGRIKDEVIEAYRAAGN